MNYKNFKSLRISVFTLGTVQLGLPYGISNKIGKPPQKAAFEILDFATKSGINSFDTSPAYGESEKIIGNFISSFKGKLSGDLPLVITKIPPSTWKNKTVPDEIQKSMRLSVTQSLKTLNLSQIPICLLHSANAQDLTSNNGSVVKSLHQLKEEGLIKVIGASVYSSEDVQEFLRTEVLEAIQIPINIFDQILIRNKQLIELKRKNILVFARSIFLQGLFFLSPDNLPNKLQAAGSFLRDLKNISLESGLSIAQIALVYVRDLPEITSLVLGVETVEQLRENLDLINAASLPEKTRQDIKSLFSSISNDINNPSKWNI